MRGQADRVCHPAEVFGRGAGRQVGRLRGARQQEGAVPLPLHTLQRAEEQRRVQMRQKLLKLWGKEDWLHKR